ncbi:MAG: hypothetical protein U0324_38860 [Polyangiales bacterium]
MNALTRLVGLAAAASSCAPTPDDDAHSLTQEVLTASVVTPATTGGFQNVTLNTAVGTQLLCDATRQFCAVRNIPLLSQSTALIDPAVAANMASGCYDASMATVRLTALENRGAIGAPAGRTAAFDGLVTGMEARGLLYISIPREYRHVSMQYWPQIVANPPVTGLPARPSYFPSNITYGYFGLNEVIRDYGPIHQPCNGYTYAASDSCISASNSRGISFSDTMNTSTGDHATDEYVRSRLRDGYNLIVAFQRYSPKISLTGTVSFVQMNSPHKVVVSGFRPGAFPLRINDVGSGTVRFARLINTPPTGTHQGVAIPAGAFEILPNIRGRQPRLEFEDDPTGPVQFVEHIDGLRLGVEAPSHALYSGVWTSGFTRIATFETSGGPHLILYNAATGATQFSWLYPSGNGALAIWNGTWATGWTHLATYPTDSGTNVVLYNAATGNAQFQQVRADRLGATSLGSAAWGTGYTTVEPFAVNGIRYVLLYNATNGAVRYMRMDASGASATVKWSWTWGAGLTHFTSATLEAEPHLLLYNNATGAMQFDRVLPTLNGVMPHFEGTWAQGWSRQAAVIGDGLAAFTLYNPTTGATQVVRSRPDGAGLDMAWSATWTAGATHLVSYHLGAQPAELLYNATTGAWSTYTVPTF